MKTLAIVVPCYNEEETIHPFLEDVYKRQGYCCDKEVLQKGLEKLSQFLNKC